jgi:hypothetical protein
MKGESMNWIPMETTTHQDHVIAHVVGATVLGHFLWDEAAYLLLDIGFIWNIYLDGEMGLLPHPVAIAGLAVDDKARNELQADVDVLLSENESLQLARMESAAIRSPIQNVDIFEADNARRLVLNCEAGKIVVETSLATREVGIMGDNNDDSELGDAAQAETEFVRQRLRAELGRDPTEEELDEWLREHTESY